MDCIQPGSSLHGISQARGLEWVVISHSSGSSRPRDWTWVSCIGRWILHHCTTWEAPNSIPYPALKEGKGEERENGAASGAMPQGGIKEHASVFLSQALLPPVTEQSQFLMEKLQLI